MDECGNDLIIALLVLYTASQAQKKGISLTIEMIEAILEPVIFILDLSDDTIFDNLSECELGTLIS